MAWFGGSEDSDMGEVEPKSLMATQILSATSSDSTGTLLTPRLDMESGRYKNKTNCWGCKTWEEEERGMAGGGEREEGGKEKKRNTEGERREKEGKR